MKDYAEVILKNNSILRFRIRNPSKNIELKYVVDDKKQTQHYFYRREKTYRRKGLFFTHRVSFYEHGNPEPLENGFKDSEVNMKDISSIIKSDIIQQLGASTKNRDIGMTAGTIIGVCAIIGIVVIVLIG